MTLSAWEETLAKAADHQTPSVDGGSLLQIHPLSITNHMIDLSDSQVVVGREPTCGICIPDASVSRRHALIEKIDAGFSVTDLGSTNGTSVNEQPVTTSLLHAGDRIQFGSYIFKFLSSNHIELQYHEAVYSMMTRDGLTGALNKRSFIDILGRDFQRAIHRSSPLSLILFDIDFFKNVNDTHGHLAGDEVLREVGRRISKVTAAHDVFARYGGEEFAILMSETLIENAVEIAERCRQEIANRPFQTSVGPLAVTISAGVASVQHLGNLESPDKLIQAADLKLYEAKHGGRNRVCK